MPPSSSWIRSATAWGRLSSRHPVLLIEDWPLRPKRLHWAGACQEEIFGEPSCQPWTLFECYADGLFHGLVITICLVRVYAYPRRPGGRHIKASKQNRRKSFNTSHILFNHLFNSSRHVLLTHCSRRSLRLRDGASHAHSESHRQERRHLSRNE